VLPLFLQAILWINDTTANRNVPKGPYQSFELGKPNFRDRDSDLG